MGVLEASWSVEIEAPRDRCYAIAANVEGAPGWQGTLEEVDVITRDEEGRAELVHTVSDATVRKVSSELRFSYDPPESIRWEQEKGEVKWLEGYWDFEELDAKQTRATYGLRGDPGRMLSLLLRGPVESRVKEFLTRSAAEGLKTEAESASA
jgi:uncharacterized membrane protein